MQDVIQSKTDNGSGGIHSGQNGGVGKLSVASDALRALPSEFVQRHRVLPLKIQHGSLHIATAEGGNQRLIEDIRLLTGLEVIEQVLPAAELLEKIAEHYQVTVEQMIENLTLTARSRRKARTCMTSRSWPTSRRSSIWLT